MGYKQLYNLPPLRGTTVTHGGSIAPGGTITPGTTIGTPGILVFKTTAMANSIITPLTVTGSLTPESALIKNANGSAIANPVYTACVYDAGTGKWICSNNAPAGTYGPGAQQFRLQGANPAVVAVSQNGVTIAGGTNNPPVPTLTIAGGTTTVATGQSVTLQASATDPDSGDSISKIEYFDNGVKLPGGETSGASGSLQSPALTAGTHSFTARATDSKGATGLSSAVVVTASTPLPPGSKTKVFTLTNSLAFYTPAESGVDMNWPSQLGRLLGTSADVERRGRPGRTVDGLRVYTLSSYQPDPSDSFDTTYNPNNLPAAIAAAKASGLYAQIVVVVQECTNTPSFAYTYDDPTEVGQQMLALGKEVKAIPYVDKVYVIAGHYIVNQNNLPVADHNVVMDMTNEYMHEHWQESVDGFLRLDGSGYFSEAMAPQMLLPAPDQLHWGRGLAEVAAYGMAQLIANGGGELKCTHSLTGITEAQPVSTESRLNFQTATLAVSSNDSADTLTVTASTNLIIIYSINGGRFINKMPGMNANSTTLLVGNVELPFGYYKLKCPATIPNRSYESVILSSPAFHATASVGIVPDPGFDNNPPQWQTIGTTVSISNGALRFVNAIDRPDVASGYQVVSAYFPTTKGAHRLRVVADSYSGGNAILFLGHDSLALKDTVINKAGETIVDFTITEDDPNERIDIRGYNNYTSAITSIDIIKL